MPLGSPGMPGHTKAYDVLLVKRNGETKLFAHYSTN